MVCVIFLEHGEIVVLIRNVLDRIARRSGATNAYVNVVCARVRCSVSTTGVVFSFDLFSCPTLRG